MSDVVADILDGTELEVRSTLLPTLKFTQDRHAHPSLLARLFQPAVTVRRNGVALYSIAPFGEPDPTFGQAFLALVLTSAMFLLVLFISK